MGLNCISTCTTYHVNYQTIGSLFAFLGAMWLVCQIYANAIYSSSGLIKQHLKSVKFRLVKLRSCLGTTERDRKIRTMQSLVRTNQ